MSQACWHYLTLICSLYMRDMLGTHPEEHIEIVKNTVRWDMLGIHCHCATYRSIFQRYVADMFPLCPRHIMPDIFIIYRPYLGRDSASPSSTRNAFSSVKQEVEMMDTLFHHRPRDEPECPGHHRPVRAGRSTGLENVQGTGGQCLQDWAVHHVNTSLCSDRRHDA